MAEYIEREAVRNALPKLRGGHAGGGILTMTDYSELISEIHGLRLAVRGCASGIGLLILVVALKDTSASVEIRSLIDALHSEASRIVKEISNLAWRHR